MNEMGKIYEEQSKANDLFKTLSTTQSMNEVYDIIESMDENMAKLVLRKFIYSRGDVYGRS